MLNIVLLRVTSTVNSLLDEFMCIFCVAALGRRGWKMFYAALCDMTLYMYSDENSYKRSTHCSNVIHLNHSLATKAGDYVKKNHVFRLQTADMAQYLIQTRFSENR